MPVPPRWAKPAHRRHKRIRLYGAAIAVLLCLIYLLSKPTDYLAMDYGTHEAYMNDQLSQKIRYTNVKSFDWRTAPFNNTPKSLIPLPTGRPHRMGTVQFDFPPESSSQKWTRERRRVAVRDAFKRSWRSYRKGAWMRDELKPMSNEPIDTFGGWAATLVDALDTLWIMGLKDEFEDALQALAQIDFGETDMMNISVFETTIRYLGGLLSAYDLSGRQIIKDKAVQVGEMLFRSFDTPNHMPLDRLPIKSAQQSMEGFTADSSICIAGLASLSMEFTRLAQITKQPKYYDAVARVTELLDRAQNSTRLPGLFPVWTNAYKQDFSYDRSFTLGAMADSAYEYFPKMYALLGGAEPVYQKLYEDSMAMVDKHMVFRPMFPGAEDVLISGDITADDPDNVSLDPEGQHLTCFVGGMFALGGRLFNNKHHVDIGAKLTEGCIYAYKAMPTGIMPEIFDVVPCKSRTHCPWNQTAYDEEVLRRFAPKYAEASTAVREQALVKGFTSIRDRRYLLRPEAIESVFILYRITGEEHYQEEAWHMFTSIMKATKTPFANAALQDVTDTTSSPPLADSMESFWMAETLKYFYLIFSPPDMIDLDEWVLNTEAHPFRRPK